MSLRRVLASGLMLAVSLLLALGLCELGARLALNPADYLSVRTVRDDTLGIRIAPGSSGFDAWGFRNRRVPATADIVAIGDSHTYGNNAAMSESWPAVTGELTGRSVYNLGLGGYGPNQYFELLRTRAVELKPRWVVVGIYLGDDFENAYRMTYGREGWAFLRDGRAAQVNADIWEVDEPRTWARWVGVWLSRHSVVYRFVVHGPVLGGLKGALQIRRAGGAEDPDTASLTVPGAGISEAFRPNALRPRLDQGDAAIREGMRISLDLLTRMKATCREHGCRLLVVVIPTKESVFADYLLRDPRQHLRDAIADVVQNEEAARRQLLGFLSRSEIPYVDTLPALRRHVAEGLYTRSDRDMHPGPRGYRVIGEAVADFLGSAVASERTPA